MPPEPLDDLSAVPDLSRPLLAKVGAAWRRPRRTLLILAGGVVIAGMLLRTVPGTVGDLAGGVLYAVLLFLLTALIVPAATALRIGTISFAFCAAVELMQLTSLPTIAASLLPPIRYVLGTTFVASDLAAYAAGTAVAIVGDTVVRRRLVRRRAGQ